MALPSIPFPMAHPCCDTPVGPTSPAKPWGSHGGAQVLWVTKARRSWADQGCGSVQEDPPPRALCGGMASPAGGSGHGEGVGRTGGGNESLSAGGMEECMQSVGTSEDFVLCSLRVSPMQAVWLCQGMSAGSVASDEYPSFNSAFVLSNLWEI